MDRHDATQGTCRAGRRGVLKPHPLMATGIFVNEARISSHIYPHRREADLTGPITTEAPPAPNWLELRRDSARSQASLGMALSYQKGR